MSEAAATTTAQDTTKAAATTVSDQSATSTTDQKGAVEAGKTEAAAEKKTESEKTETKETETKETQAAAKVVPEKYELKLPEGSVLDAADIEKVSTFAKEQGLTNDQAQAILEQRNDAIASFVDSIKPDGAKWNQVLDGFEQNALADPEIGGSKEKLAASAELAKRGQEKFGAPGLLKLLHESGYGSHPEVIRHFRKLGQLTANDKLVLPGAGAATKPKSREEKFYPNAEESSAS